MELTHLFDLALRYDGNAPECPPPGAKEGRLLGSGEGSAEGALLRGKVRWSTYEHTLAPGLCRLQIPGVIQTDDGAEIQFEAHGYAMQSDSLRPNLWPSAGAFLFTSQNARYSWLVKRPVAGADSKSRGADVDVYAFSCCGGRRASGTYGRGPYWNRKYSHAYFCACERHSRSDFST